MTRTGSEWWSDGVMYVKIYWSYKQFPELAGLSPEKKKELWWTFVLSRSAVEPSSRKKDDVFVGVLIISLILGMFVGAFSFRSPALGVLIGGIVGIILPMPFFVIPGLQKFHGDFKVFMETGDPFASAQDKAETHPLSLLKIHLSELSEEDLKRMMHQISYGIAEFYEVSELSEELMNNSIKLLQEARDKDAKAMLALKSWHLMSFIILEVKAMKLQSKGMTSLMQAGRVLFHAKRSLEKSNVISESLKEEL